MKLEIDFTTYPAGKLGDIRIDVPLREPLGKLKKALRGTLRQFLEVESAYLLLYSNPLWNNEPQLVIVTEPRIDSASFYGAWQLQSDEFGVVGCVGGQNALSIFASHCALPFYVREYDPPLPPAFSRRELIDYIRLLPDRPVALATAEYPNADEWDYLKPSQAKSKSTILELLENNKPFGLFLRSFSNESTTGRSMFGEMRTWVPTHPMRDALVRFSPHPLVGIANPSDPFRRQGNISLIEVGENWLQIIQGMILLAANIYIACDRINAGVSDEFCAIQASEREDDTFILVSGSDQAAHYENLRRGLQSVNEGGPEDANVLTRRVATFGLTGTTEEIAEFFRRYGDTTVRA